MFGAIVAKFTVGFITKQEQVVFEVDAKCPNRGSVNHPLGGITFRSQCRLRLNTPERGWALPNGLSLWCGLEHVGDTFETQGENRSMASDGHRLLYGAWTA